MFRWYVVNTYSGHENKVKANLEHRIESMGQRQRFRRVVVPTEQVIETKDGQKVKTEKRVLPGYGLVNMDMRAGAVPPRPRPGRTGERNEGPPESPDREARPSGLRARQHGHERRGLDGGEE